MASWFLTDFLNNWLGSYYLVFILTNFALRLIQSISCDFRVCVSVCLPSWIGEYSMTKQSWNILWYLIIWCLILSIQNKEVSNQSKRYSQKVKSSLKVSYIYSPMLRSQIPGSFEFTKTNEVNLHDFCTDSFLKWLKLSLRVY